MKRLLSFIFTLSVAVCPLFGQATDGFHRVSQVLTRAQGSTTAQVVPYAKISVSNTSTGTAATIYSDPLLTSQIVPAVVTADASGNYSYYISLNTCVTETISSPGYGTTSIPNICSNSVGSGTVSGQASGVVPLATGSTSIEAQSHINENTAGQTQVTQKLIAPQFGPIYYADGFPSSCTVGGVAYTTQLDCAWYTALSTISASSVSNPTVVVGSGGSQNYTTCAGLQLIPSGYTGRNSVNLVNAASNASNWYSNTPAAAVITQSCPITNGVIYLPDVSGGTKTVTVNGVSVNAGTNAPYALQLVGTNYRSVMHNDVWIGGTTYPTLVGDGPGQGWTYAPDFQNWTVLPGVCPVTNGCGSGATATASLSGGVPTITVTAGGSNYDSNTKVWLIGYQNGTSNVPCSSMGTTTPTIASGVITAITTTASGCSGSVYVVIYDASPQQYGIVFNGVSDAANLAGFDIQAGFEAGFYAEDVGTSTIHGVHSWAGGLYGTETNNSAASFEGTDCGETSAACFNLKGNSTRVDIRNTLYHSSNQYQGFSMFRVDSVSTSASVVADGLSCQTLQSAEYHTLATASGTYDGLGGVFGPSQLSPTVQYCGSATSQGGSATSQPVNNAGTVVSNHSLFFTYSSNPYLSCQATGYASKAPTLSGSVLTFYSDGSHNGGSVQCTDDLGNTYVQGIPSTGGSSQTFDMSSQFATSGTVWIELGNNFLTLNGSHTFVQNGVLAKGSGGTVAADTLGALSPTGGGAAIPTGPSSTTSGDAAIYSGASGKMADAGYAPLANGFLKLTYWGAVAGTGTVDLTPALPHAITIDSATVNFSTAPNCTTYPTLNLWDYTANASVASVTPSTSSTSYTLTVTNPSVPSGHQLAWRTSAYTSCTTNATNGTLNVFYH